MNLKQEALVTLPIHKKCLAIVFVAVSSVVFLSLIHARSLVAQDVQDAQLPALAVQKIEFAADYRATDLIAADLVSSGWLALFDGNSKFGWRAESEAIWQIKDGLIVAEGSQPGLLRTASQFDCFRFSMQYRCEAGTDASVFFRTSPRPSEQDAVEVALDAGDGNEFRTLEVEINASEFAVWVDGVETKRIEADQLPVLRGYIGFQCQQGKVQLKDVWLRPLLNVNAVPADSEPNAASRMAVPLNWTASTENDFVAATNEQGNVLTLTGGPGYVESDQQFSNFVLQAKCKISVGGNSGIFYRCVPGENTLGYESQIDNRVAAETADTPANCGTGGIFRRKDARQIVAADETWFAKTIVAEGPHVAVWVNGYQVTDWTDKRKADRNPRRGLRVSAGTLMLQGHDAETTTEFREINVRELLERRSR